MRRIAVLVAIAAIAIALLASREGPGICPHDASSCFFSENYRAARARFREAAARANASRIDSLVVSRDADLTIDVAVLPAAGADPDPPTLVHFSGTHGVEAYAGSAIQLALLEQWRTQQPRGVRIVLVHAVNPFGFHCGRRWNEDGADLNRNLLEATEFELLATDGVRQALYDSNSWLFNEREAWVPLLHDLRFLARAAYALTFIGFVNVKRCFVTGQYHEASGAYFGGRKLARSHELLIEHLREVAAPASRALLLDVHTGLGPTGVDTLIPSFEGASVRAVAEGNANAIHSIFAADGGGGGEAGHVLGRDFLIDAPTPGDDAGAAAGYDLAKGTTFGYLRLLGWPRALSVAQEFGTLPGALVMRGMIVERAEFVHRPVGEAPPECGGGTARGARASIGAFYVRTATWQAQIVRRGVRVVEQAMRALMEGGDVIPVVQRVRGI